MPSNQLVIKENARQASSYNGELTGRNVVPTRDRSPRMPGVLLVMDVIIGPTVADRMIEIKRTNSAWR
jgi:hypothetical protein